MIIQIYNANEKQDSKQPERINELLAIWMTESRCSGTNQLPINSLHVQFTL
jgi:hypothetical protein